MNGIIGNRLFRVAGQSIRTGHSQSLLALNGVGGPAPDQPQDVSCEALNAERTRLLAQRDDLNKPQLSVTDAEREAMRAQLNGKLYTVEKAQFNEGCPAVANASPSVVR